MRKWQFVRNVVALSLVGVTIIRRASKILVLNVAVLSHVRATVTVIRGGEIMDRDMEKDLEKAMALTYSVDPPTAESILEEANLNLINTLLELSREALPYYITKLISTEAGLQKAQAEIAVMRKLIIKELVEVETQLGTQSDRHIYKALKILGHIPTFPWPDADAEVKDISTAGKAFLDEMKAKDERIAELEKKIMFTDELMTEQTIDLLRTKDERIAELTDALTKTIQVINGYQTFMDFIGKETTDKAKEYIELARSVLGEE